ncbi:hypothetical protein AAL_08278 [Moelleriella libera RCEF 2490]|uniref:DUF7907 domain-containing protein n=1 Tax=Moelleriella libera RCEF 2490 TaxID=1081109 RepID=A0A167VNB9_9HYPO|nr:hypothetical protein AAL_08278 [Moelleriella libera RCEF 2490]
MSSKMYFVNGDYNDYVVVKEVPSINKLIIPRNQAFLPCLPGSHLYQKPSKTVHIAACAALVGVTTLTPLAARDGPPILAVPPTAKSQAFNLIVNATNLDRAFSRAIQASSISSLHVGAGLSLLRVSDDAPRIFYINGTETELHFAQSTVISDAAAPPVPYGISLISDDATSSTAHLDAGPGAKGIGLTRFLVPYVFLYPETYSFKQPKLMSDNYVPM